MFPSISFPEIRDESYNFQFALRRTSIFLSLFGIDKAQMGSIPTLHPLGAAFGPWSLRSDGGMSGGVHDFLIWGRYNIFTVFSLYYGIYSMHIIY